MENENNGLNTVIHNRKIRITEESFKTEYLGTTDISCMYNANGDMALANIFHKKCLNNFIISEGIIESSPFYLINNELERVDIYNHNIFLEQLPLYYIGSEPIIEIKLIFKCGLENIDEEYYYYILELIDSFGWYHSHNSVNNDINNLYTNFKEVNNEFYVIFKPKFDVQMFNCDIPKKLYYIGGKLDVNEILNKGLLIHNNTSLKFHSERSILLIDKPSSIRDSEVLIEINAEALAKNNKIYINQDASEYKSCFITHDIHPSILKIIDHNKDVL